LGSAVDVRLMAKSVAIWKAYFRLSTVLRLSLPFCYPRRFVVNLSPLLRCATVWSASKYHSFVPRLQLHSYPILLRTS